MIRLGLEQVRWLRHASLATRLAYLDSPSVFFRRAVASSVGLPKFAVARPADAPDLSWNGWSASTTVIGTAQDRSTPDRPPEVSAGCVQRFAVDPEPHIRMLACKGRDLPSALVARFAATGPVHPSRRAGHPHLPVECLPASLVNEAGL